MNLSTVLIFLFIFGAMIGSFLNVVIYRYPIMLENEWNQQCYEQLKQTPPSDIKSTPFNLCMPRSQCCHCHKQITWWHNIPIISFLWLCGKCAACHQKISRHYFLVEILTAFLTVFVYLHFGATAECAAVLVLTYGLIASSFIDLKHQFLPDPITYILLWLGLLLSTQHYFISAENAILGALIGYLFLWSISKLYLLLRKQEGMGLGDCKLLAMFGAWVGPLSLLNVLLFSTVIALMVSAILIFTKKHGKNTPIPFGPYLAIAGWCTILFGPQLTLWIASWSLA